MFQPNGISLHVEDHGSLKSSTGYCIYGAVLPGVEIIDRSSVNAYDDARVARVIEATGRKKLIFAGLSLEVCAALPAMTVVRKGFDAYVPWTHAALSARPNTKWGFCEWSKRRSDFGLLHIDDGDSQGQSGARSAPRLRSHGYGLGQARRSNL